MSKKEELSDLETITERSSTETGEIKTIFYKKSKFLGKGGFARVYEMICQGTGETYAGKLISKDHLSKVRARHKLMSEIKIHRSLSHQNVVKFHRFFEDEEIVYILLEMCPNQTFSELLRRRKRLTELEVQCYLTQVLTGLRYLHSLRVIHRDIKLANVFLSEKMEVKLGDFGLSAKLEYEGERKRTICGTPNYMAPEILDGKVGHSYECDVWSFGVLMYTLLVGRPPFETKDVKTTYRRIKMYLYNFPESIEISVEAKRLITSILILEPSKRPTLEDIVSSEFFTKNSIPKYLPISTLAIPPSQGYMRQFYIAKSGESSEKFVVRASSQENDKEEEGGLNRKKRNASREPQRNPNKEAKVLAIESAYQGNHNDGPDLWVRKWLDYFSRYGVGYLLSNNCVGVVFNDNTKIVMNPPGTMFQYITSSKSVDTIMNYAIDSFPPEHHKKVMLLQLFKKQLISEEGQGSDIEMPYHHVKKCVSTAHAMVFRMSNKLVQVWFRDSSELIMSSEKKHVTFISKEKEVFACSLAAAMECGNKQMIKRLKYSKEILASMLKGKN